MIVNKEKALNLACVVLHASCCLAAGCMAWKGVGISKDMGCCGLVYPNIEIIEMNKIRIDHEIDLITTNAMIKEMIK